ncbi:MAG: type II secretion system protein [Bacteroidetes bacterium]|nr:type II secretion system protein [Bacteroidota bacterium]
MLKQKKIKAFTLLEFLVVISLSGIVVTLSYVVWNKAMESFSLYESDTRDSSELMRMQGALQDDFFEAKSVVLTINGVICKLSDGQEIEYDFSGDEILRKVDDEEWMIEVENVQVEFFREHEKQKETAGLVDEIRIEFTKENEEKPFVWKVYKRYGFSSYFDGASPNIEH